MTQATALGGDQLRVALQGLPGWEYRDNAIERVVRCPDYRSGLALFMQIGELAEAENHHPDLALNYTTLIVRYWTHTAQGVTEADLAQARKVEALLRDSRTLPAGGVVR